MTQPVFSRDALSFAVCGPVTEAGRTLWLPSHAVVGKRVDFYVFTRAAGTSAWIKGQPERFDALKRLHVSHQKEAFIALVEKIMWEHPRPRWDPHGFSGTPP